MATHHSTSLSKPDQNDLQFVIERYGTPKRFVPERMEKGMIHANYSRFWMGGKKFVSVFHSKPVYYEHINGSWQPLSEVTEVHGNHLIALKSGWENKVSPGFINWLAKRQKLLNGELLIPSPDAFKMSVIQASEWVKKNIPVGLTTSTFYPDPNVETTTVDGYCFDAVDGRSWATVHDLATSGSANDSSTISIAICDALAGSGGIRMSRHFFLFDTSSIPDSDEISAAVFSAYGDNDGQSPSITDDFVLVQSTPASNTAITTADFDAFTLHSDVSGANRIARPHDGAYRDFTMTSTGRGWISKTGVTKLGLRCGFDFDATTGHTNTPPGTQSHSGWRMADYASTTSDPKLVVTHAAAAAASAIFFGHPF